MSRTFIQITASALFLTVAAGSPAFGQQSDLEIFEFPQRPVSTEHLALESMTVVEDQPVEIQFRNFEGERVLLTTFISDYRGPWRVAHRREFRGQSSGTWVTPFEATGEYLLCAASDEEMEEAYPPQAPHEFTDCTRVFAVIGSASYNPRPSVEISSERVRAGVPFSVRYAGMPDFEGARVEIVRRGFPTHSVIPDVRHPTRGQPRGEFSAVLPRPGQYELRILYDNIGRQVRARQIIDVLPR